MRGPHRLAGAGDHQCTKLLLGIHHKEGKSGQPLVSPVLLSDGILGGTLEDFGEKSLTWGSWLLRLWGRLVMPEGMLVPNFDFLSPLPLLQQDVLLICCKCVFTLKLPADI